MYPPVDNEPETGPSRAQRATRYQRTTYMKGYFGCLKRYPPCDQIHSGTNLTSRSGETRYAITVTKPSACGYKRFARLIFVRRSLLVSPWEQDVGTDTKGGQHPFRTRRRRLDIVSRATTIDALPCYCNLYKQIQAYLSPAKLWRS